MSMVRIPMVALAVMSAFALELAVVPSRAADSDKAAASEGQERPRVSAHIAGTLKRANDALQTKNYDLTLMELDAADAMPNKSAYDQRIIDQMRAFAKARQNPGK